MIDHTFGNISEFIGILVLLGGLIAGYFKIKRLESNHIVHLNDAIDSLKKDICDMKLENKENKDIIWRRFDEEFDVVNDKLDKMENEVSRMQEWQRLYEKRSNGSH